MDSQLTNKVPWYISDIILMSLPDNCDFFNISVKVNVLVKYPLSYKYFDNVEKSLDCT